MKLGVFCCSVHQSLVITGEAGRVLLLHAVHQSLVITGEAGRVLPLSTSVTCDYR